MDATQLSNLSSMRLFLPEAALTLTILALLVSDLALPGRGRRFHANLSLVGLAAALLATIGIARAAEPSTALFDGLIVLDPFAVFFKVLFVLATAIPIVFTLGAKEMEDRGCAEFYSLMVASTLGMFVMASSNDILMIYLSLELLSLSSYVLAGYRRDDRSSSEAALKYVVYGGVASGTMLFGFSIIYGLTGTTSLPGIRAGLAGLEGADMATLVAIAMSMAGFGYKIASVPFHMWAPDVYQGAPTPVTAFFSVGPKAAGFAALTRFFYVAFVDAKSWSPGDLDLQVIGAVPWPVLLGVMAALTMTVGNLAAIGQKNIKRMLAYSSIAHAGYMLMAFVAVSEAALTGLLFYLAVYLVMNFGVWVTIIAVGDATGSHEIEAWRGLGFRAPMVAVAMAIFLFSLTGLPPFAGFIGKFYLFYAVLAKGSFWYVALGVCGVANSVVSLYYYAYIIKTMYFEQPDEDAEPIAMPRIYAALQAGLAVPTLLLGIYWAPLYEYVRNSVRLLL